MTTNSLFGQTAASTKVKPAQQFYHFLTQRLMSRLVLEVLLRATDDAAARPSKLPANRLSGGPWRSRRTTARYVRREVVTPSRRLFSSNATPKASTSPVNTLLLPAFESFINSLSSTQPCFGARGDEVSLLFSPVEFKASLLDMIKRARRRIIISSLYIGVEEDELVSRP